MDRSKVRLVTETVKGGRAYHTPLRVEQARRTRRRIAESARGLFMARGYQAVTMAQIAADAGVAYQTVYAVFGNKQRLAQEIIWTTFEVEALDVVLAQATGSPDPEAALRSAARIARVVSERLGALLCVLRESGDPGLRADATEVETRRRNQEQQLAGMLARSGGLRAGLTEQEALDVLWTMTGTQVYQQLVDQQGWAAERYEEWLSDALVRLLLTPGH